jgi:hypothetical protein
VSRRINQHTLLTMQNICAILVFVLSSPDSTSRGKGRISPKETAPFARIAPMLYLNGSVSARHHRALSVISYLVYTIPFAFGLLLIIALFNAQSNYRRSRRAPYFRIRQDSLAAFGRWLLVIIVAGVGIGGGLFARRFVPTPSLSAVSLPTLEPLASSTPGLNIATITPDANAATKDYLAIPPTITPTQPTPTASSTPFITTIESQITPLPNAAVTITAISSGLSNTLQPVNADTEFPAGIPRLYVWFEYSDMTNGISWSRAILWNGVVLRKESEAWELGESGKDRYYFFDSQNGWPSGSYEVQFYIGDKLASSVKFSIIN